MVSCSKRAAEGMEVKVKESGTSKFDEDIQSSGNRVIKSFVCHIQPQSHLPSMSYGVHPFLARVPGCSRGFVC